jgi:hypothetical protein
MDKKNKKYIKYLCNRLHFSKINLVKWEDEKMKIEKNKYAEVFMEMCEINIEYFKNRIESLNLAIKEFRENKRRWPV